MFIRSPIVSVLGHVDHGKTTLLDKIRQTFVVRKEAGGITQMIGASYVRKNDIEAISSDLKGVMPTTVKIPGILFIDTPGHEAFTSLRERGGSIADLAILIVDINEGFKPQTVESLGILKRSKTPFVIAANKIDLVSGWKKSSTFSFLKALSEQPQSTQQLLEEKLYTLIGEVSTHGFDAERFDRVSDFRKTVAVVPTSAKTGVGLAELLLLIAGLSHKFMEKRLELHDKEPAKGTVMEVRFEKGMGNTLDTIIYDGVLHEGDRAVFCTKDGVVVEKIRAVMEYSLSKKKYRRLKDVPAAAGVKLVVKEADNILSGSPFEVVPSKKQEKDIIEKMRKEIGSVLFTSDKNGVIVKADSIGSIEAILKMFAEQNIAVRIADTGAVVKRDVIEASAVSKKDKFLGVVFAFNVMVGRDIHEEAEKNCVPIIASDVIYRLLEQYEEWKEKEVEREKMCALEHLPWPCKVQVLGNCFFRHSKPAIFGVRVLGGKLKPGIKLMNEKGDVLGQVKQIQLNREAIHEAKKGDEVAISCVGFSLDDIKPDESLFVMMDKAQVQEWKKFEHCLCGEEKEILGEIRRIVMPTFKI